MISDKLDDHALIKIDRLTAINVKVNSARNRINTVHKVCKMTTLPHKEYEETNRSSGH